LLPRKYGLDLVAQAVDLLDLLVELRDLLLEEIVAILLVLDLLGEHAVDQRDDREAEHTERQRERDELALAGLALLLAVRQ
jgi:hypothetical protein